MDVERELKAMQKPPHDFECCEPTERKILRTLHYEPSGVDEALQEAQATARREALEEAARIVETKVWNAQFNVYFYPMGTSLASAIRAALGDAPESGK